MYRQGNEPFTWHPIYRPGAVTSWYARSTSRHPGVTRWFDSLVEFEAAMAEDTPFEYGYALPAEEPIYWTQSHPELAYQGSRLARRGAE
jgi:hypothetical protein